MYIRTGIQRTGPESNHIGNDTMEVKFCWPLSTGLKNSWLRHVVFPPRFPASFLAVVDFAQKGLSHLRARFPQ